MEEYFVRLFSIISCLHKTLVAFYNKYLDGRILCETVLFSFFLVFSIIAINEENGIGKLNSYPGCGCLHIALY